MKPLYLAIVLLALLAPAGCQHEPVSTAGIEERFLGWGYARQMYRHGEQMEQAGRYREALAAFTSAEMSAYTEEVRLTARQRRMWLEQAIKAMEKGKEPPERPAQFKPKAKTTAHTPVGQAMPLTPDGRAEPEPRRPEIKSAPLPPGPNE